MGGDPRNAPPPGRIPGAGDVPTTSDALQDLVARAAGGERAAQEVLLSRYWPVIRRAVRGRKSRLGDAAAARDQTADIEQDAALRVLGELRKHTWQGRSAFAAWIKKLSELQVIDAYRHNRAKKRDAAADIAPPADTWAGPTMRSPESLIDQNDQFDSLLDQIDRLKPEYGAALLMHHLGFTHAEIGDTLGCTPEAARKLVTRARLKLL